MWKKILVVASMAFAPGSVIAAPTVTYLSPSGGQVGSQFSVTAVGTMDKWPVQVWSSHPGIVVKAEKDKGKFSASIDSKVSPGVHYLRFFDDTGASPLRPFIVGTLPESSEQEPNDDAAKPQAVAGDRVVNGKLDKSGDVDSYSVSLKAGQTLVASLEANHLLRSPIDAVMQVVSSDGFVLETNNDHHGIDPQVAFTATKAGNYLVRVFSFPAMPDSSIRFFGSDASIYRLTLTTGAFVEAVAPLAIPVAGPFDVRPVGWNLTQERVTLTRGDGDAVLVPGGFNGAHVRVETNACIDATRTPAGKLVPPVTVTGLLDQPGKIARYDVELKKGKPVRIAVESREIGLEVNPMIRVLQDSKVLVRAEPKAVHKDTEVNFTPPNDGLYLIDVSDQFGMATMRSLFRLRVTTPTPDYELTTATDRVSSTIGKAIDVPVTVVAKDGFKQEVAITVEGLPPMAKFEVLPAPKANGPRTVRITSTAPIVGVPIRIIGKVDGIPPRIARSASAELATPLPYLWLTIASK